MEDVIVGLLAVSIGAVFCFRGYLALRLVIPLWGALTGFLVGAGLVDAGSDDGFLRSALAWIVGFALAGIFGALAYLYYEVSVVIAMGAIGFTIGTASMVAIGVSWSWLIVLVGIAVAAALAVFAIVFDLPMVVLMVLSALAGATTIVAGGMLLTGAVDTADFDSASVTERLDDDWWWYALYVVLVVAGFVSQVRSAARLDATVREAWHASRTPTP